MFKHELNLDAGFISKSLQKKLQAPACQHLNCVTRKTRRNLICGNTKKETMRSQFSGRFRKFIQVVLFLRLTVTEYLPPLLLTRS